jgi:hypothetical protein
VYRVQIFDELGSRTGPDCKERTAGKQPNKSSQRMERSRKAENSEKVGPEKIARSRFKVVREYPE